MESDGDVVEHDGSQPGQDDADDSRIADGDMYQDSNMYVNQPGDALENQNGHQQNQDGCHHLYTVQQEQENGHHDLNEDQHNNCHVGQQGQVELEHNQDGRQREVLHDLQYGSEGRDCAMETSFITIPIGTPPPLYVESPGEDSVVIDNQPIPPPVYEERDGGRSDMQMSAVSVTLPSYDTVISTDNSRLENGLLIIMTPLQPGINDADISASLDEYQLREPPPNYENPERTLEELEEAVHSMQRENRKLRQCLKRMFCNHNELLHNILLLLNALLAFFFLLIGIYYIVGCHHAIKDYTCAVAEGENVCNNTEALLVVASVALIALVLLSITACVLPIGDCGRFLYLKTISIVGIIIIIIALDLGRKTYDTQKYTATTKAQMLEEMKQCSVVTGVIDSCWANFRGEFCPAWILGEANLCTSIDNGTETYYNTVIDPNIDIITYNVVINCTEHFAEYVDDVHWKFVARNWIPILILGFATLGFAIGMVCATVYKI